MPPLPLISPFHGVASLPHILSSLIPLLCMCALLVHPLLHAFIHAYLLCSLRALCLLCRSLCSPHLSTVSHAPLFPLHIAPVSHHVDHSVYLWSSTSPAAVGLGLVQPQHSCASSTDYCHLHTSIVSYHLHVTWCAASQLERLDP